MLQPITPDNSLFSDKILPDQVIKAVNELLITNWDGNKSAISKKELAKLLDTKMTEQKEIKHYIHDILKTYRRVGWNVFRKTAFPGTLVFSKLWNPNDE